MRIIISPAKKMKVDRESLPFCELPVFIENTEEIKAWLCSLSFEELKKLWGCNESIAKQNQERLADYEVRSCLTPAILSYEGIQYQYMAPAVFEEEMLSYIQEHLRILSGFYGVLRPMDGVIPYRLEMQAKAKVAGTANLYDYWGSRLYENVRDSSGIFINLASKEYSKCMEKYLQKSDTFITCVFAELVNGKAVQKGTYAKMARGEMVRYMAEYKITEPEMLKNFDRMDYVFSQEHSSKKEYVFLRMPEKKK